MLDASLRAAVQARLQALHLEYSSGNAKARELERQQAQLNEVMLRISGAIQVLEETLAEVDGTGSTAADASATPGALSLAADPP